MHFVSKLVLLFTVFSPTRGSCDSVLCLLDDYAAVAVGAELWSLRLTRETLKHSSKRLLPKKGFGNMEMGQAKCGKVGI